MGLIKTITRRQLLIWIGSLIGVLILLSILLTIYIGTRSDEWWRDQVSTTLSQTLGREVDIQGTFQLDLGRRMTIEVASVHIGNPKWAESRDMLRLGSLLLEFDLLSLLSDVILIHRLELADVELALEENKDGEKNWEFVTESKSPSDRQQDEGITLPVLIEQLSLDRAQLSLIQPRWNSPLILKVEAISGGQSPNDKAVLHSHGQLGNLPFSFEGSFGKLSSALNNGPVSYQLSGNIGKAKLKSEGSIDSLSAPLRPKLDLLFSGPDIKTITQAMGAPTIATGPFEARIDMGPGGRGVKTQVRGKFGNIQLHADVAAEDLASTKNMDVTARLSGKDLAAFSDLLGLPPLPKGSFKVNAVVQSDEQKAHIKKMTASVGKHRLILEGVIGAWPELNGTQLTLNVNGPELAAFTPTVAFIGLGQLPSAAYSVNAVLEQDKKGLRVHSTKIVAGDYQATAEGFIHTKDRVRTELTVMGSGPDLSMISRLAKTIQLPSWPFQVHSKIIITSDAIKIIGATGRTGITGTKEKHEFSADGLIAFSKVGPISLEVKGKGPSLQAVLEGLGYKDIPASAAYQLEGMIELSKNRLRFKLPHVNLGSATASATFSIPNLNRPTTMTLDLDHLKTSDVSAALDLVGVKLNLPRVMPANMSGQIKRTEGIFGLSKIRADIGATNVKVDGSIGKPPRYDHTHLNLDISGPNLEHFLTQPINQAIPFQIKGGVSLDKDMKHFQNLQLQLANIEAKVDGKLSSWERIKGTELNISARATNLDVISAILNKPLPAGTVSFDSHIVGIKDGFHIDRLNAVLGLSNLSGDLKLQQGETPLLIGRLNSTYIDYPLAQKEIETKQKSESQKKTKSRQSQNGTGKNNLNTDSTDENEDDSTSQKQTWLFPDTAIKLAALDRFNLDLDVHIDELANLWARGSLHDIKGKVMLKGRDLSISNFGVRGADGSKVKGDLKIVQDADATRVDLDVTGEQLRFGFAAAAEQTSDTYSPSDIEMRLSATGTSYRKLAASVQGRIKVIMGEGQINHSRAVSLLSNTFYELFQTLNPFAKTEPTTRLNCGVGIINMADGIAEIQTAVVQTDKLTIVSAGNINLNTEQINVGFNTRPRKGLGISVSTITNSYIKLGGRLTKPVIELDPEGATLATGAAVATGGLSFLFKGFWDRFLTSRDPCGEALKADAELQDQKRKKAKQP